MNGITHFDLAASGENEPATVERTCERCGKTLRLPVVKLGKTSFFPPRDLVCLDCHKQREVEKNAKLLQSRLDGQWEKLCPDIFRVHVPTEIEKLPDQAAYRRTMEWKHNREGLLLVGETGTGKTRTAYLLLRRLLEAGREIHAFSAYHGEFANECAEQFSRDCTEANTWMRMLKTADVVFFDDLGKAARTERAQAQFFELIEGRISKGLPIIATMNKGAMDDQFTTDRLAPLKRRLFQFCQVVKFCNSSYDNVIARKLA